MAGNEALAPGHRDVTTEDDADLSLATPTGSPIPAAEADQQVTGPRAADPQKADPQRANPQPVDPRKTTARVTPRPAPRPAPLAPARPTRPVAATSRTRAAPDLLAAVEALRTQIGALSLGLDVEDADRARADRNDLIDQLDDYLLPRLRRPDAPLLAVIGGSTGAGKSTLTNSLVRREVSRSGVLRPTTRSPVLVHHPDDSGAFLSQRILPRLTRVTSEAPEPAQPIDPHAPRITGLRLVPHEGLTPGLGIIDAPDIDSLVETNRDLAVQLLGAADLWIFVTTAARYADAVPWQMLRQAGERGVAVAVVLDRVPPESMQELRVDLATRLKERGLAGAPIFTIPETGTAGGFLPDATVKPLRSWLIRIAGSEPARRVIAERTLLGIARSVPARAEALARAAAVQAEGWAQLAHDLRQVVTEARPQLLQTLSDGSLIRGEVLARWQEFVADGELVRRLDGGTAIPGLEWFGAVIRPDEVERPGLAGPVAAASTDAVRSAIRAVREGVLQRWSARSAGAALVTARAAELPPLAGQFEVERSINDWREGLEQQIADALEQAASEGDPIAADVARDVLFMVVVDELSDRPGRDAETSVATVAAARRMLAGFIGEDRIRSITTDARADLAVRAAALLHEEGERIQHLVDVAATDPGRVARLQSAAAAVTAVLNPAKPPKRAVGETA